MRFLKHTSILLSIVFLSLFSPRLVSAATRIHFISLDTTTDAILLESNGHYGMVDSGEDWDYPNSAKYPFRSGITVGVGYEQQVIHYLKQLGVEKLDFYIATHSHSDHIGSGDEILRYFPTERLYINRYDDSYMFDAHGKDPNDPYYVADAQENRLWDNQYVYDCLIQAAQETGVQVITDLDLDENASYRSFTMGDMSIEIMNYERLRDDEGNIIPVSSENNNCLVTKITAFNHVALLTSDMEPLDGDTTKIALQLIDQLTSEDSEDFDINQDSTQIQTDDISAIPDDSLYDGVILDLPESRSQAALDMTQQYSEQSTAENSIATYNTDSSYDSYLDIDDSKPNTGTTISIDLMKMIHHSVDYNNTTFFLTSLNPKTAVITGSMSWFSDRQRDCLPNTSIFVTQSDSAAVISTFTQSGVSTSYSTITPGWMTIDTEQYYFDKNGRTLPAGAHTVDNRLYYFDKKGALKKGGWISTSSGNYYSDPSSYQLYTGWHKISDNYYYFYSTGIMAANTVIGNDYVDSNGVWIPGYSYSGWIQDGSKRWYRYSDGSYPRSKWEYISNKWYYFDSNGYMVTGWLKDGSSWYYLSTSGAMQTGWAFIHNSWYYFNSSGQMATGFISVNGTSYYLNSSGQMLHSGWHWINGKCYYMDSSGAISRNTWIDGYYVDASGKWIPGKSQITAGWILSNGRWWYRYKNGSYPYSKWEHISGKWYYFDSAGWMVTGWLSLGGNWYYFAADGSMLEEGWHWISGKCYYMYSSGVMASNTRIDNFYVDSSGAWVPGK